MPNDRRNGAISKGRFGRHERVDTFYQETYRAANAARAVMVKKPLEVTIRTIQPTDVNFIIDAWCETYRRSQDARDTDPELFKVEQRARINRLLPRSKQLIACDKNHTSLIYGWACFEPPGLAKIPVVHYMCIKPHAQMQGIGKELLRLIRATAPIPNSPVFATHRHLICKPQRLAKYNVIFNNYLLEVLHPK